MIQRVRDVIKNARVQHQISFEEWTDIENRYAIASDFISEENPIYLQLKEELKKAEDVILENRIHEVHEVQTITKVFKKIFITPREEQLNELVGQIKFVRGLLGSVESWIARKEEVEKLEQSGQITIDRDGR